MQAGLAGAGVERGGDAGVSLVVSLHFPSFPSRAFLFSFLALPRPVAGPAPLPSDVHQWWQEESGLCRAVEHKEQRRSLELGLGSSASLLELQHCLKAFYSFRLAPAWKTGSLDLAFGADMVPEPETLL